MAWLCWYPSEDDPNSHVVPDFGPAHELSAECWCHPEPDQNESSVIIHNGVH